MGGKSVQMHSTQQALALGIGYVPRNRKENGIIKDMNILENGSIVTWPRLARRGLIDSLKTPSPASPAATSRRWCWPSGSAPIRRC